MKKLLLLLGFMLMTISSWAWDIEVDYPPVYIDGCYYYFTDDGAWLSYGAHRGYPEEPEFWIIDTECYSGNVIVPESVNGVPVVGIKNQTFVGCSLTSLQLPNTIKKIGNDAFYNCTCPEVRIPGSVETIGSDVFSACNFNKLVFEYGTTSLKFTGRLFNNSSVSELYIDRDYVKDSYVRFNPASLKKVTIGDNMTELSNSMFEYNQTLESITFGLQIKEIPNAICNGCSALKSIYFSNGITHIGQRAFSSCSALSAIIIPEGVTHIDESAFKGCSVASELSLPSTLKVIRSEAFYGDVNLASVSIPASVDSIGTLAFYNCRILDFTIEDGNNPINLQFYNSYPWCGILDDSPLQRLHLGRKHTGGQTFKFKTLKSVSFGDAVDEINEATFQNCDSLTSITWGKGLKRIGKNAFNNCKSLPSITIPEGVTQIDESAFNGCFDAAELSLPSTLTNIGANAFNRCYSLLKVTCQALTPPQMQNSYIFLDDTYNNGTLYVPNASIEDYRQADYWYRFSNIAAALIPGDVDGDGQVGIADVTALIDYILGNSDSSFIVANADVDGDSSIGIADVTAIIDTLLGN